MENTPPTSELPSLSIPVFDLITATSVDIAISSACTHSPSVIHRGNCSRHSSGRLRSVAIPSLADRYWISIAIRFASSTTHSSR